MVIISCCGVCSGVLLVFFFQSGCPVATSPAASICLTHLRALLEHQWSKPILELKLTLASTPLSTSKLIDVPRQGNLILGVRVKKHFHIPKKEKEQRIPFLSRWLDISSLQSIFLCSSFHQTLICLRHYTCVSTKSRGVISHPIHIITIFDSCQDFTYIRRHSIFTLSDISIYKSIPSCIYTAHISTIYT